MAKRGFSLEWCHLKYVDVDPAGPAMEKPVVVSPTAGILEKAAELRFPLLSFLSLPGPVGLFCAGLRPIGETGDEDECFSDRPVLK